MSFTQKSRDILNNNYISALMKFKFAFLGEAAGKSIMIVPLVNHGSVIYLDTMILLVLCLLFQIDKCSLFSVILFESNLSLKSFINHKILFFCLTICVQVLCTLCENVFRYNLIKTKLQKQVEVVFSEHHNQDLSEPHKT